MKLRSNPTDHLTASPSTECTLLIRNGLLDLIRLSSALIRESESSNMEGVILDLCPPKLGRVLGSDIIAVGETQVECACCLDVCSFCDK